MSNRKIRLTTAVGATMALVMVGTAAVAAAGPRDDGRGFGPGKAGMGEMRGGQGMRGIGPMRGALEDFERRETTIQTEDGTSSFRVEQGLVESVSDASLDFTLGSGEAVTVVIDEDTEMVAFEETTVTRRGRNRERMAPTQIEATDLDAGAEIVVWSESEDGGEFVAERVVLRPITEEMTEDGSEVTDAEVEDSADADPATEEAATTDA